MHLYRTHNCDQLRIVNAGQKVRLSGWVHRTRDHGNLLFIDLRDHYGITQCVIDSSSNIFAEVESVSIESVITVTGSVKKRSNETVNSMIPSGEVEVWIEQFTLQASAALLPLSLIHI